MPRKPNSYGILFNFKNKFGFENAKMGYKNAEMGNKYLKKCNLREMNKKYANSLTNKSADKDLKKNCELNLKN